MDTVLAVVNRSNQRGGRMLSVVDLLEAGTLSIYQASWLLERVLGGASWLVGATPGGAGKTTVMSAILAMAPGDAGVRLTNRGSGWRESKPGEYVVSYELSPGFYDAYVWGEDVVRMTELGMAGCRIVSNLHVDTLQQAREQIVGECGSTEQGLRSFQIFVPLALKGPRFACTPTVEQIDYVRDGRWRTLSRREIDQSRAVSSHSSSSSSLGSSSATSKIAEFLMDCRSRDVRLIEDVRERWLEWYERNGLG
jgi:hypothetical protein